MVGRRVRLSILLAAVALAACGRRERAAPIALAVGAPDASARSADPIGPAEGAPSSYLGREIAPPMSWLAAEWLDRPEREEEEQPEHMLDILRIREGETVADVGAGSGFYTERLSRRVGPTGKVIGTDLQPEMLARIHKRVAAKGLTNVETILATEDDARLPEGAIDLVLMVDVYHELGKPLVTLAQVLRSLRPNGRLALVEFRAEDPKVPIKSEHKMSLPQIEKELGAGGFRVDRVDESLPWQRVVIAVPR